MPVALPPGTERRTVAIDDLKEHPRNPRQGDVGAIVESIERNGVYRALTVQTSTRYVLAGNHTLKAMRALGHTSVVIDDYDCDDETALRILLADNRTADLATYDDAVLLEILVEEAKAGRLAGTGYTGDDVDQLIRDLAETVPVTTAQLGDVSYRVLIECDDERHQADLLERLQGEGLTVRALAQ